MKRADQTALKCPAGDRAFLRVKLARVPADIFFHALGGFAEKTPRGVSLAWLPEDDALLRQLWAAEVHRNDMARLLERSIGSCYTRAHRLGLPERKPVWP